MCLSSKFAGLKIIIRSQIPNTYKKKSKRAANQVKQAVKEVGDLGITKYILSSVIFHKKLKSWKNPRG